MQSNEYMVDLGGHPPYHQPPEGLKMPSSNNGAVPFSSDSGSEAESSLTSSSATANVQEVDRNRNFT